MSANFSRVEKLGLAFRLMCLAPWEISVSIVTSLVISWARGLPLRLFIFCAVIKVVLRTFSPRQIQYMSLSTKETYKSWIRRKAARAKKDKRPVATQRLNHDLEPLEDGNSSLLWVGNHRKAKKVVLFFHGGGYVSPLLPGHLEWCWRSYVVAGLETGIEVAVAVLEYTLCPDARYPVQLRQAASALECLLLRGFHPRDIVIGGDSAGANMTAQLLCHLIEPHPAIRKISLSKPLAGAFLVSPWLTRRTDDASFKENAQIDMLSGPTIDKSTRELLGHTHIHETLAFLAFTHEGDKNCLNNMSSAVDGLYVTVGSHEVLRDQAVLFVHEVKYLNPRLNVRFEMQERQAHDFILLEGQEERDGENIRQMKTWMKDLLTAKTDKDPSGN